MATSDSSVPQKLDPIFINKTVRKNENFLRQSCRYASDLSSVKISPDLVGWLRSNRRRFTPSDLKPCDAEFSGYGG